MYLFTLSTYQKKYSKRVRTQKKSKVFDITAMRVNPQKLRWKLIFIYNGGAPHAVQEHESCGHT